MAIRATIIADSISTHGKRLTTFQLEYPRFIHSELMTHRQFSRNAMSSRAVPVAKMIEQVRTRPAMPIHWGKNQPDMQANEQLTGSDLKLVQDGWSAAAEVAANIARDMDKLGAHKQVVNRILEPFQWMHTLVSATEWDNFYELRLHKDAEPNFQALARAMHDAHCKSTPVMRERGRHQFNWHLPYVTQDERNRLTLEVLIRCSVARCARVSYLNHDQTQPDVVKDLTLYERLVGNRPIHASPTEHQASPTAAPETWSGNFRGWRQHREEVEFNLSHQQKA